jgi:hypothetical protein
MTVSLTPALMKPLPFGISRQRERGSKKRYALFHVNLAPALTLRRLPPALQAVGLHVLAGTAVLALATLLHALGQGIPAPALPLAEGLLAGSLSRLLGLPLWWQFINLLFFPAVALMAQVDFAAGWYLAGFLLLALTSLGAVISRVPLYLSSARAMQAVASRIPRGKDVRVIDLGCGLGGLLVHLARARPDIELHGVDAAPLPWLVSRLRLRGRAAIRFGSLWEQDLAAYDVVYAYLSPAPMTRLWEKARREMRPGSLFISNSFTVHGAEPDEAVELGDLSRARLLIWRIPAPAASNPAART